MRAKRAKTFDMGGQVFDEVDKGQIRGGGFPPPPTFDNPAAHCLKCCTNYNAWPSPT